MHGIGPGNGNNHGNGQRVITSSSVSFAVDVIHDNKGRREGRGSLVSSDRIRLPLIKVNAGGGGHRGAGGHAAGARFKVREYKFPANINENRMAMLESSEDIKLAAKRSTKG